MWKKNEKNWHQVRENQKKVRPRIMIAQCPGSHLSNFSKWREPKGLLKALKIRRIPLVPVISLPIFVDLPLVPWYRCKVFKNYLSNLVVMAHCWSLISIFRDQVGSLCISAWLKASESTISELTWCTITWR